MTNQFDMDETIQALREGKDLTGKDGVLTPLIKQLTEAALAAELDQHLRKMLVKIAEMEKPQKILKQVATPSS